MSIAAPTSDLELVVERARALTDQLEQRVCALAAHADVDVVATTSDAGALDAAVQELLADVRALRAVLECPDEPAGVVPGAAADTDAITSRPSAPRPRRAAAPDPALQGRRALVVEDDPAIRQLVVTVLRSRGMEVTEAATSGAALLLTRGGALPELLVTDILLPGIDGRTLAANLCERQPGLAVLFMSGFDEASVLGSWMPLGREAFLRKPFGPQLLVDRARALLAG